MRSPIRSICPFTKAVIATVLITASLSVIAQAQTPTQTPTQTQPRPLPPGAQLVEDVPPPPQIDPATALKEQVTVTTKGADKVEEYRANGRLYKMRVVPPTGAAYWLLDPKGDGNFVRVDGPAPINSVPMWVIHEW